MNNTFSMFLLFSILVTGLIVNPLVFAQETPVNATETTDTSNSTSTETTDMTESSNSTSTETTDMTESSNSTSTETTDTSSNSTSPEGETMVVEDELETELETEDEMIPTVLSPLKQIKEGVAPENIVCKEGLELVFKLNGQPACVKTTSIQKLIAWGWTQ